MSPNQPNNTILITGATGFLGRNLCLYLTEQGVPIRALVRTTSDYAYLESLGAELIFGDVRDASAVARAVSGCRSVIHAAGKFRLWGERSDFFDVNVLGTQTLLEQSLQARVSRFLYVSTIAVVGHPPGGVITEETPCDPQDAYQESKLEAERLVQTYWREQGLPAVILRPGAYYGPWGRYGFNRIFFEDPLTGLPFQVHRGRHVIFPVFVRDVARASAAALDRGQPGEIYNICGRCLPHRQVNRIVERVASRSLRWVNTPAWGMIALARLWTWLSLLTRREPYYPIGLYPYVFYDWPVSIGKAERELGFVPTPFEEGVRVTLSWYWEQGILPGAMPNEESKR